MRKKTENHTQEETKNTPKPHPFYLSAKNKADMKKYSFLRKPTKEQKKKLRNNKILLNTAKKKLEQLQNYLSKEHKIFRIHWQYGLNEFENFIFLGTINFNLTPFIKEFARASTKLKEKNESLKAFADKFFTKNNTFPNEAKHLIKLRKKNQKKTETATIVNNEIFTTIIRDINKFLETINQNTGLTDTLFYPEGTAIFTSCQRLCPPSPIWYFLHLLNMLKHTASEMTSFVAIISEAFYLAGLDGKFKKFQKHTPKSGKPSRYSDSYVYNVIPENLTSFCKNLKTARFFLYNHHLLQSSFSRPLTIYEIDTQEADEFYKQIQETSTITKPPKLSSKIPAKHINTTVKNLFSYEKTPPKSQTTTVTLGLMPPQLFSSKITKKTIKENLKKEIKSALALKEHIAQSLNLKFNFTVFNQGQGIYIPYGSLLGFAEKASKKLNTLFSLQEGWNKTCSCKEFYIESNVPPHLENTDIAETPKNVTIEKTIKIRLTKPSPLNFRGGSENVMRSVISHHFVLFGKYKLPHNTFYKAKLLSKREFEETLEWMENNLPKDSSLDMGVKSGH